MREGAFSKLGSHRGVTYLLLEPDRRPVRVAALLDVRMMFLRYAGHLPVCIPYMIVHSLKSQMQTDFIICFILYAIAMWQIITIHVKRVMPF